MSQTESRHAVDFSAQDLAALQGVWEQIGCEENGVIDPPDAYSEPGVLTTIHDRHFEVRTACGDVLLHGCFTLDATTSPKSMTWIDAIGADKDKPLPASYELDGDRFVFIAADPGMPQPVEFVTRPGLTLRRLVRYAGA